ncbi:arsenate reductase family protein [Ruminococcus sp. FMB-CY1]|nr:arsenate reductase family protein [Ruminococcus sp. FMB-CY1]
MVVFFIWSDIMLFLEYPKCSTCKKAKNFLDSKGADYEDRHIVENNPTAEELKQWHEMSGLDIKKFFNTSGMLYKSMNLKDKLPQMSLEEKYQLLATDGMLVKRPILINGDKVLTGFKEAEWEDIIG